MRRMITEKDVEKLDSIKPSEIEKLAAMQDPKTATAGQILTADGTGKAVYKKAVSATVGIMNRSFTGLNIKTDASGTYIEDSATANKVIGAFLTGDLKMNGTTSINLGLVSVMPRKAVKGNFNGIRVYFSPEAITQYSITSDSTFSGDCDIVWIPR